MNTHKEKLSLLIELVEFSIVDGHLHQREYDFIAIVANELKIEKSVFESLFHKEIKPTVLKSEFQRIQQFYRLALLMHID